MIKQLTSKRNLNQAYLQVYRNKGAGGVDKVQVTELKSILKVHAEQYIEQIDRETYQVFPILGVEIPKSNGKTFPQRLIEYFNKHYIKYCSQYSSQTFKNIVMDFAQNVTLMERLQQA